MDKDIVQKINKSLENAPDNIVDLIFTTAKSFSTSPKNAELLLRTLALIWEQGFDSGWVDGVKRAEEVFDLERKLIAKESHAMAKEREYREKYGEDVIDVEFVVVTGVKH